MTTTNVRSLIGAVTTNYATMAVLCSQAATKARMKVATNSAMTTGVAFGTYVAPDSFGYVQVPSPTLVPNTRYYVQAEIDGVVDTTWQNTFKTAPSTAASFAFGFGGCSLQAVDGLKQCNPATFVNLANRDLAFFMHLGDFAYMDIGTSTPPITDAYYRQQTEKHLAQSNFIPLMKAMPFVRVWDDHDWAYNNSDRTAAGGPAAARVYRQMMPSYPLQDPAHVGDWHSFTWGRVLFLMLDSRAYRDLDSATDGLDSSGNPTKTFLGATQKAWLKDQLKLFDANDALQLCIIGNPQCWISSASSLGSNLDTWGQYTHERAEIANFIALNVRKKVGMVASDMHGIALDDGTHADYTTQARTYAQPMFVAQSGALAQTGGAKGGPYTSGTPDVSTGTRFGICTITDDGTTMSGQIDLYRGSQSSPTSQTLVYSLPFSVKAVTQPIAISSSTAPIVDRVGHSLNVVDSTGHTLTDLLGS